MPDPISIKICKSHNTPSWLKNPLFISEYEKNINRIVTADDLHHFLPLIEDLLELLINQLHEK